jgi:ATP-dependent helicase/nuclease subunit A
LHEQTIKIADGTVKRYSRPEDVTASTGAAAAPAATAPAVLPPWLLTTAPPETATDNLLRPSDPAADEGHPIRTGESIELRARALQRGTLVHRLLQSLPEVPMDRRRDAARRYLARNADGWTEAERVALAGGVLTLLEHRRFAAVFAPGSRAEVSIAGRLDRPGRGPALVSGQIDRLVVTPEEVLIVDYKTNRAPPRAAPRSYVRQLALYRAVLKKLYPQLPVRAALLWTETPELMEVYAPALDAELEALSHGMSELDPATSRS